MCYDNLEVNTMENEHMESIEETEAQQVPEVQQEAPETQEEEGYTPRPPWQVWAARIGLVLFILVVALYYIHLFRGVK